jgi:hypothetical protein
MGWFKSGAMLAVLCAPLAANAATVTFNFVNADSAGSRTFTGSDGVTTIEASATNNSGGALTSYIDSAARGLYVCTGTSLPANPTCGLGYGDTPHVDAVGVGETVHLTLGGGQWRIDSATFHPTLGGNFDLGVNGTHPVFDELALATFVSFAGLDAALRTGSSFSFGADDITDYFKLSSVTLTQVPLPGTLGLLGLGLAGLGMARRRQAS